MVYDCFTFYPYSILMWFSRFWHLTQWFIMIHPCLSAFFTLRLLLRVSPQVAQTQIWYCRSYISHPKFSFFMPPVHLSKTRCSKIESMFWPVRSYCWLLDSYFWCWICVFNPWTLLVKCKSLFIAKSTFSIVRSCQICPFWPPSICIKYAAPKKVQKQSLNSIIFGDLTWELIGIIWIGMELVHYWNNSIMISRLLGSHFTGIKNIIGCIFGW